jgi:uncharacterized protein (UPF0276 family)
MRGVGFTLQPEDAFLDLLGEVLRNEADYYEVAPETLWRSSRDGVLQPNGFHARFLRLREETGRPFVAHGVGFSVGTGSARDQSRRRTWLRQLRLDQRQFQFLWYTDHLGATALAGEAVTLPLPLPMTADAAQIVRRRLRALQSVVPEVGVENNVAYFLLGDALEEPGFLAACTRAPGTHLLLDLHNLYTMSVNFGFDSEAYLARLDLPRVIELHLSGGTMSDGQWLQSGRVFRLDSHAAAVPDEVWRLFERTLPRCTNLRGVTLERMEGTVTTEDVPVIREELRRIRRTLGAA